MQNLRHVSLLAVLLLLFGAGSLFAQDTGAVGSTGSPELDGVVSDLDSTSSADAQNLLAKLSSDYGVPLATLSTLQSQGYKVGEIWLALQLAKVSGQDLNKVIALAAGKDGHGWGLVAQTLGIKPGSKDFLAMVDSGKGERDGLRSGAGADKAQATASEKGGQDRGGEASDKRDASQGKY